MYGAFLGDIIGSPYEFDRGEKTKDFELFNDKVRFTDDSVMTAAVAEALMDAGKEATPDQIRDAVRDSMRKWARAYPNVGYGARFTEWFTGEDSSPYNSYGNGSAMRVSAAGWLYDSIERTREAARATAEPTHNHPEGITGAEAVASAIYLARTGSTKDEIKDYIEKEFGYDLSRTCDEIRPGYHHMATCRDTVPEAITAFLEGIDLEDVIRTAVSLGGDVDTVAAIAGSIAEAYYGAPILLVMDGVAYLPDDITDVIARMDEGTKDAPPAEHRPDPGKGNEPIEQAIANLYEDNSDQNLAYLLFTLSKAMNSAGSFYVPIEMPDNLISEELYLRIRKTQDPEGKIWFLAYTSEEETEKGDSGFTTIYAIDDFFKYVLASGDAEGILLNPWGRPYPLPMYLIQTLF